MKFLKILVGLVACVIALLGVAIIVASFGDGPTGLLTGGELRSGELVTGPEPDFGFARDLDTLELQLVEPPESRTVWLQVVDGKLYVVSGYMNSTVGKIWKKWPAQAEKDPRAVVRIDGKRYERRLVRIMDDAPLLQKISAEIRRKYGVPIKAEMAGTGDVWFFALAPR